MKSAITLDPWQKKFLDCKDNKILCCGRQVGKSEICGMDGGHYALNNPNKVILMIAPTERQAFELFDKVLNYIYFIDAKALKMGVDRPTKTVIKLKNGTKILCLPTGVSGIGIRGYTIHRLYVDEAARIPDEVWAAVKPMMLTTGGKRILLSTPAGKGNYFARVVTNEKGKFDNYVRFSIDSETCIKERKICKTWSELQRKEALELLAQERVEMTILEYAQEYEGKLVDELRQFFSDDVIRSCMKPRGDFLSPLPYPRCTFLGVDVAGMGGDETVLFSLNLWQKKLYEIDKQVFKMQRTTATVRDIKIADHKWNYNKIYIDDGGMGVGVFDPLLECSQTKRKVCAINNSARSVDNDKRKKKLLKEDLYNHLLNLMERGQIFLVESEDTFQSLKSIQAEYSGGKLKIFGRYTHITEALIRAAWGIKGKRLNIWIC